MNTDVKKTPNIEFEGGTETFFILFYYLYHYLKIYRLKHYIVKKIGHENYFRIN